MCDNFIRDPSGIAPDPRGIENDRAVIAMRLQWLRARPRRPAVGARWRWIFYVHDHRAGWDCLLVNLLPGYLRPDKQAGVVLGDSNLFAPLKSAIPSCGFVVAFRI